MGEGARIDDTPRPPAVQIDVALSAETYAFFEPHAEAVSLVFGPVGLRVRLTPANVDAAQHLLWLAEQLLKLTIQAAAADADPAPPVERHLEVVRS